jgi:hypothetical protein
MGRGLARYRRYKEHYPGWLAQPILKNLNENSSELTIPASDAPTESSTKGTLKVPKMTSIKSELVALTGNGG